MARASRPRTASASSNGGPAAPTPPAAAGRATGSGSRRRASWRAAWAATWSSRTGQRVVSCSPRRWWRPAERPAGEAGIIGAPRKQDRSAPLEAFARPGRWARRRTVMAKDTKPQDAKAANPLQGVRVLAVDDEVDILETIEDVLEG